MFEHGDGHTQRTNTMQTGRCSFVCSSACSIVLSLDSRFRGSMGGFVLLFDGERASERTSKLIIIIALRIMHWASARTARQVICKSETATIALSHWLKSQRWKPKNRPRNRLWPKN